MDFTRIYFKIDNNMKLLLNQHFRMISGSCDTEDWSNDANNSVLNHTEIKVSNAFKYKTSTIITVFFIK